MIGRTLALVLTIVLGGTDTLRAGAPSIAFDRITLRDRSVALGLVTSVSPQQRGPVEFLIRRDWARKHLPRRMPGWERSSASAARIALAQRKERLRTWRKDRAANPADDDRIIAWIDDELPRLSAPGAAERSVLLRVRMPRDEVAGLQRRAAAAERLPALAWLCNLPDPESMPINELTDAIEARGYAADAAGENAPPSLDRLLPPVPETEPLWLARRAATELASDSGLRFLRFQEMVVPDTGAGQLMGGLGLSTAMAELKRLFDPDDARRVDPLLEKLTAIEARGRRGAVVTRLEIQPDLDGVTVETTLWICVGPKQWVPFGSRSSTVRPADVRADAGQKLADDPQVKGAFGIVEALGLGSIPGELKERSLRIGAATEKALGTARSAFNQDLEKLGLPVLEPRADEGAKRRQ